MSNEAVMDGIDHDILLQLRKDGRLSNVDLAKRVGLSPPACLRRVKRLEDANIIRGYRAIIDPSALGHSLEVFVWVDIDASDQKELLAFEATVSSFDEVVECHRVFGHPDYFMRVLARDPAAYEDFQTNKLIGLPAVLRVTSTLSLRKVKTFDTSGG